MSRDIILSAVGDEPVIAHPTEVLPPCEVAAVAAGSVVYLLAHTLFGYRLTGSGTRREVFATSVCVSLVLAGLLFLVLAALIVANYLLPLSTGALHGRCRLTTRRRRPQSNLQNASE